MINIVKGFIIGILKIAPGVSGSMMAISFGIYERLISIISNIFHINFKDFTFLATICIGIFSGIILFSGVIKWLLSEYYFPMMFLFIGLIASGFKELKKNITFGKNSLFKMFLIGSIFMSVMYFICNSDLFSINKNGISFFIMGCIEVFTSIVPGISGTAIFMSLGAYESLLDLFSNLLNPVYFKFNIFFITGIFTGLFVLSKLLNYLFKKHHIFMNLLIFVLMTSSFLMMVYEIFTSSPNTLDIIIGSILFILGYKVTSFVNKIS